MEEAGHQGVDVTLHRLREYCAWRTIDADAREFVPQCLHSADYKTGAMVPRPLAETNHGRELGDVMYPDFRLLGRAR